MKKMNKIFGIIGVLILTMPIIAYGVSGLLDSSKHRIPEENTEWIQYKIECSYSNVYYMEGTVNEFRSTDAITNRVDDYCLELQNFGLVIFRIPTEDIDYGLYRLVIVMGVYDHYGYGGRGGNSGASVPVTIKLGTNVADYDHYYINDNTPSGPPGSDWSMLGEIQTLPVDFGLIYFQKETEDHHNLWLELGNTNGLTWFIDEIILTPA